MDIRRRIAAAVVGVVLVFIGHAVGLFALFALSSGDGGDLLGSKKPSYGVGLVAGSISLALIVGGFAAAALISLNERPLRATLIAVGVFALGLTGAAIGGGIVFDDVGTCMAIAVAILAGGRRANDEGAADHDDKTTAATSSPLAEANVWRAAIAGGVLATVGLIAAVSSALALDYTLGGFFNSDPNPVMSLALGALSLVAFVAAFAAAARLSRHPDPRRATLIALAVVVFGLAVGVLLSSAIIVLITAGSGVALATRYASRGVLASRIAGVGAVSLLAPVILSSSRIAVAPLLVALAVPVTDHFVAQRTQYETDTR